MKKVIVSLTVCFSFMSSICSAEDFETSVSIDYMSKYLGSAGAVYENKPVVQPCLSISHSSGFYANLWGSVGTVNEDGDELDYIAGWTGDVGGGFKANVGVGYWDFQKMFSGREDNVWNVFAEISHKLITDIDWYVKTDTYFPEPGSCFEGGFAQYLGVRTQKEKIFGFEKLSANSDMYIAYDDGAFGTQPCASFQYRLGANYAITDKLTIGPKFAISAPFSPEEDDAREFEVVWGLGASYTF